MFVHPTISIFIVPSSLCLLQYGQASVHDQPTRLCNFVKVVGELPREALSDACLHFSFDPPHPAGHLYLTYKRSSFEPLPAIPGLSVTMYSVACLSVVPLGAKLPYEAIRPTPRSIYNHSEISIRNQDLCLPQSPTSSDWDSGSSYTTAFSSFEHITNSPFVVIDPLQSSKQKYGYNRSATLTYDCAWA